MADSVDRLCIADICSCDKISVSWTNGELTGHLDSVDRDFVADIVDALVRMCERRERNGKV